MRRIEDQVRCSARVLAPHRVRVLPNALEKTWNQPDQLVGHVIFAMRQGFAPDVLDAARHLADTDPQAGRGGALLCVCLLEVGDHEGAKRVLLYLAQLLPGSAVPWTSLAKVAYWQGRHDDVSAMLPPALEADPNRYTYLAWYQHQREATRTEESDPLKSTTNDVGNVGLLDMLLTRDLPHW